MFIILQMLVDDFRLARRVFDGRTLRELHGYDDFIPRGGREKFLFDERE